MTANKNIDTLIFHCSDSDLDAHDNIDVIRGWHLDRGWSDVGYHYFIRRDGSVQHGRKLSTMGAHVKGHNSGSIGVCLHGKVIFTEEQYKAARAIYDNLKTFIPDIQVFGHNHFNQHKTCPNFDVNKMIINGDFT